MTYPPSPLITQNPYLISLFFSLSTNLENKLVLCVTVLGKDKDKWRNSWTHHLSRSLLIQG